VKAADGLAGLALPGRIAPAGIARISRLAARMAGTHAVVIPPAAGKVRDDAGPEVPAFPPDELAAFLITVAARVDLVVDNRVQVDEALSVGGALRVVLAGIAEPRTLHTVVSAPVRGPSQFIGNIVTDIAASLNKPDLAVVPDAVGIFILPDFTALPVIAASRDADFFLEPALVSVAAPAVIVVRNKGTVGGRAGVQASVNGPSERVPAENVAERAFGARKGIAGNALSIAEPGAAAVTARVSKIRFPPEQINHLLPAFKSLFTVAVAGAGPARRTIGGSVGTQVDVGLHHVLLDNVG